MEPGASPEAPRPPYEGPGEQRPRTGPGALAFIGAALLAIAVIVVIVLLVSEKGSKHSPTINNQSLSVGHTTSVKTTITQQTTTTAPTQTTTVTAPTKTVSTPSAPTTTASPTSTQTTTTTAAP
jgi:hypothetical protein